MKRRMLFLLIAAVFLFPPAVFAHRVSVFAYQEGDKINVEGFFSDGTPTKQATIEVYDMNGKKLFAGKTNEKGTLQFETPKAAGKLKIVLVASMGHRAEILFKLRGGKRAPAGKPEPAQASAGKAPAASGPVSGISEKAIRTIVREEVARAIQPVMRALAKQEAEKISFSDVVGGIGWIMGLMGIWLMMKARKK